LPVAKHNDTVPPVKIGFLGGSFDPVHFGHLLAAQDAYEQYQLDRLILVPAAQAPLKPNDAQSSADDRLAMVRAATEWDHRFEVSDIELRRGASATRSIPPVTSVRNSPTTPFIGSSGATSCPSSTFGKISVSSRASLNSSFWSGRDFRSRPVRTFLACDSTVATVTCWRSVPPSCGIVRDAGYHWIILFRTKRLFTSSSTTCIAPPDESESCCDA
jgi:cytidyltransferase-like protein